MLLRRVMVAVSDVSHEALCKRISKSISAHLRSLLKVIRTEVCVALCTSAVRIDWSASRSLAQIVSCLVSWIYYVLNECIVMTILLSCKSSLPTPPIRSVFYPEIFYRVVEAWYNIATLTIFNLSTFMHIIIHVLCICI